MTQASIIEPSGPVVVYQFTVAELRSKLATYAGAEFATPAQYRDGTKALAVCRTLRGDIEAKRKALKSGALEYGRRVDSVAKQLTSAIEEVELPLKARKAVIDYEKERVRREKEEAERAAREAEIRKAREEEEARLRAEREAEAERLAEMRAQVEAERAELARELARLDAERQAREAEERKVREANARFVAEEQAKLEAERRAVEEERRKHEREIAEHEARIRAQRELRELTERQAREAEEARVREAERRAELARRLEALRPEKERALMYLDALLAVEPPTVQDEGLVAELAVLNLTLADVRAAIDTAGES